MSEMDEIKAGLGTEQIIIGTDRTITKLKQGKLQKVFVTKNAPESVKKEINHYSDISDTEIVELNHSNVELGTFCKKQFHISVIGILKV